MATYTSIIVEDDEDFAELLEAYIMQLGNLTVLAKHGDTTKAALDIEKLKPDIVFLDVNISGLAGPEFMELVEHQPQIIVVSGHSPRIMEEYDLEITSFIQKPFTKDDLREAVEKCIAQLG